MATTQYGGRPSRENWMLELEFGRFGRQALQQLPELSTRQQVEGYSQTVSHPGVGPRHGQGRSRQVSDFRGPDGVATTREWWRPRPADEPDLVWLTAPVPAAVDTTFTFAGASPGVPDSHLPPNRASLYADDVRVITFELGLHSPGAWVEGDWALEFIPKQTRTAIDGYHRQFEAAGCAGIYRLAAPGSALTAGQPLQLKVVLESGQPGSPHWFALLERPDVLDVTPRTNTEEIEQLQHEIIRLKQTVGSLARRSYPELFTDRLDTDDVIVYTDGWSHVHSPDVDLLHNGDLLVCFRDASEHVSCDGKIVTVRSTDAGKTWGDRQVLRAHPNTDEREASIAQLRDGTVVMNAWVQSNYDGNGKSVIGPDPTYRGRPDGAYIGRSTDYGRTWTWLSEQPIDPAPFSRMHTSERILELPSGELLMATYANLSPKGEKRRIGSALYASADGGLTWQHRSTIGDVPGLSLGEPALTRTQSGRLIGMLRNEYGATYLQVLSDDDGHTWSPLTSSGIPGRANPASLLPLPDGPVLCVYGSRHDVRGIYVVASYDDGATWDITNRRVIRDDFPNWDLGYPSSVLMPDGRILVVYYFNMFDRYFIVGSFFRWN